MKKTDFNDNWSFCRLGDEGNTVSVTLPHDALLSEKRTEDSAGGYNTGWFKECDYVYEKDFDVPEDYRDKKVVFEFEGVYRKAEVYLNGEKVYFRPYGYTNFYVDATAPRRQPANGKGQMRPEDSSEDLLRYGGKNTIKVIARNADQPNSRWYSGAGIYRPVWMYTAESDHIALNGVKVRTLSINPARIEVTVKTEGEGSVSAEIYDGGKLVQMANGKRQTANADGAGGETVFTFDIEDAKLWDCENPYLYKCKVKFGNDEEEVLFGIRQTGLDAKNGFRLNGKRVLLRGACVHHDNGLLGAAAHPFAEFRKVRLLKENGYNSIRSAHNPCSKAMLDACDALGVLMIDEFADMWYIHKTKYDYAGYFEEWWRQDVSDMIDKDYNHPSVIMYSIGNEVSETAQERGIKLSEEMSAFCREKDPSRFVTCGINLFFNFLSSMGFGVYSDKKAEKSAADAGKPKKKKKGKAVGSEFFNNLAGLLGAKFMKFGATLPGSDKKTRDAFSKFDAAGYNYGINRYKKDVIRYPDRVILGSETFCSDAYKFIELAKTRPSLIGDFVWTGMDYLGEVGLGAWEYKNYAPRFDRGPGWIAAGSGRLDITGKPSGETAYTRVAFGLDPIHIGVVPADTAAQKHSPASWRMTNTQCTWSWNGFSGNETKVEVYVRAHTVKLFINGKPAGAKKLKNNCRAVFKVRYFDGEITAKGYDKEGKEIAVASLRTAGDETVLSLFPERETVEKNGLCYVRLMYTDKSGSLKPLARGDIKVNVTGGTLLALGNGCPYNERGYLTDTTDTYYGEALAIIKPEKDVVKVAANSPYGSAEASIVVI